MCRQQLLADGIPPHKIAHILTGIDPDPFLQTDGGSAVRHEFNIPSDAPLVGIIASLEPNKAQDIFLQAAAQLRPHFPNARFLLVGTDKSAQGGEGGAKGYFHQKLERQVEDLGLSNQVIFTGFRRDIPNILAALDILVLVSNMEALPVTIMEAMTAAKPVVATAVGGILDLVEDGQSGILVPPRNPTAVASALQRLLTNPTLAQQMGQEGRKIALRRMTVQGAVRQNEAMYEEVLAEWRIGDKS
jgi:glycosyltransferase involved in cell wall biosynthesis